MKLGIVGLPNVGKSTLFNSLTKAGAESANYPFCTIDPNVGIVTVPDERLQLLGDFYHSRKVTPAVIEFVDIAGLVKGASKGEGLGNQFLAYGEIFFGYVVSRTSTNIVDLAHVLAICGEVVRLVNRVDLFADKFANFGQSALVNTLVHDVEKMLGIVFDSVCFRTHDYIPSKAGAQRKATMAITKTMRGSVSSKNSPSHVGGVFAG